MRTAVVEDRVLIVLRKGCCVAEKVGTPLMSPVLDSAMKLAEAFEVPETGTV